MAATLLPGAVHSAATRPLRPRGAAEQWRGRSMMFLGLEKRWGHCTSVPVNVRQLWMASSCSTRAAPWLNSSELLFEQAGRKIASKGISKLHLIHSTNFIHWVCVERFVYCMVEAAGSLFMKAV